MDMAAFKQMSGGFYSAFPDLKHVFEDMVAEGDKVAARGVIRGTHKADFMGIKATNKQIAVSFMVTIRLAGAKNAEQRVVLDLMGLMQQLGAIPAPAQAR
jgi:predicted ester cyclase